MKKSAYPPIFSLALIVSMLTFDVNVAMAAGAQYSGNSKPASRNQRSDLDGKITIASIAAAQAAVQQKPFDAACHSGLANALFLNGKTQQALPEARLAVEFCRTNPLYHYNLACLQQGEGDLSSALAEYQATLQLSQGIAGAFLGESQCLYASGQRDEAISLAKQGLALYGKDSALWIQLSLLELDAADLNAAGAAAQRAVELAPGDHSALRILAQVCLERGDSVQAIRHGWMLNSIEPKNRNCYLFLARACSAGACPDSRELERVVQSAHKNLPSDRKLFLQLGVQLLDGASRFPASMSVDQRNDQLKLLGLCQSCLSQAEPQYGSDPAFGVLKARCLEGQGQYKAAVDQINKLEEALERLAADRPGYPSNALLSALRSRIEQESNDLLARLRQVLFPINQVLPLPEKPPAPIKAQPQLAGCRLNDADFLSKMGSAYGNNLRVTLFDINNVGCFACLIGLEERLRQQPGIIHCEVPKRIPARAVVVYDDGLISLDAILDVAGNKNRYSVGRIIDLQNNKDSWKLAARQALPLTRNGKYSIRFWDLPQAHTPAPVAPPAQLVPKQA